MQRGLELISTVGEALHRPECVLAHQSGYLFASDWSRGGGVSVIAPDGSVHRVLASRDSNLRPNGIALEPGGSFLLAHLGDESGGVFRLWPDGSVDCVLDEVNGAPLPPTNFVYRDTLGRLWITVSTRTRPRADAYRGDIRSGFMVLVDEDGPRIVADDLGYTNECVLTLDGETLYVNETFARQITAFSVGSHGQLGNRRVVARFGAGTFPDGLCLSMDGSLWVSSIISNRIIRILPSGQQEILLEDSEEDHLTEVERAYAAGELHRQHLDQVCSQRLGNVSSLAFGGGDLTTGYLGNLLDSCIYRIPLPVAGIAPPHWSLDIEPLIATPGT